MWISKLENKIVFAVLLCAYLAVWPVSFFFLEGLIIKAYSRPELRFLGGILWYLAFGCLLYLGLRSVKARRKHLIFVPAFLAGILIRHFFVTPHMERAVLSTMIVEKLRQPFIGLLSFWDYRLKGHLLFLKIFTSVFGATIPGIIMINIILGSLSVIVFYYLGKYVFEDRFKAAGCALASALSSAYLAVTSTESYTATAVFFSALTFMLLFRYIRFGSKRDLYLSLLSLFIAFQAKPEYFLIIPLYFLCQMIFLRRVPLQNYVLLAAAVPALILLTVTYDQNWNAYGMHVLPVEETNQAGEYLRNFFIQLRIGLPANVNLFLQPFSLHIKLLTMLGVILAFFKKRREAAFFVLYYLAYATTYSIITASPISANNRHCSLLIPMILFSGFSLGEFVSLFKTKKLYVYAAVSILCLASAIMLAEDINLYHAALPIPGPREEYNHLVRADLQLNNSCVLFTNGRSTLLPFVYPLEMKVFSVQSIFAFQLLDDLSDCSYFYSGHVSREVDKIEEFTRIYNVTELKEALLHKNYSLIHNHTILSQEIFLYKKG